MSAVAKCLTCDKYNFKTLSCDVYKRNIPRGIFIHIKECDFYNEEIANKNEEYNDVPFIDN